LLYPSLLPSSAFRYRPRHLQQIPTYENASLRTYQAIVSKKACKNTNLKAYHRKHTLFKGLKTKAHGPGTLQNGSILSPLHLSLPREESEGLACSFLYPASHHMATSDKALCFLSSSRPYQDAYLAVIIGDTDCTVKNSSSILSCRAGSRWGGLLTGRGVTCCLRGYIAGECRILHSAMSIRVKGAINKSGEPRMCITCCLPPSSVARASFTFLGWTACREPELETLTGPPARLAPGGVGSR